MHFLRQAGTEDSTSATDKLERPDGPWRILLVDDEPADCTIWADILRSHGCIVQLADNGEDGFSICERFHKLMDTPAELFWTKVETRIRLAFSERTQLYYGPFVPDLTSRRVLIDEKELPLTPIEFDILCRLSERTGHIFTLEEIHAMIWGSQPWDGGQLVQMHMSRLRRKLEKAWEGHHFIETVWGRGYRFVPMKK